jgi:hypothetical protein
VDTPIPDWIGYVFIGAVVSMLLLAPFASKWRRHGKALVFAPKVTGIIAPVLMVCLFVWTAFETLRHWTFRVSDWMWIGLSVGMIALFLRATSPWITYVDHDGIRTRTWFGKRKLIAWQDIGALIRYQNTGSYGSSGCEIVLHGGECLRWDDYFHDGSTLARVISKQSGIPVVPTSR